MLIENLAFGEAIGLTGAALYTGDGTSGRIIDMNVNTDPGIVFVASRQTNYSRIVNDKMNRLAPSFEDAMRTISTPPDVNIRGLEVRGTTLQTGYNVPGVDYVALGLRGDSNSGNVVVDNHSFSTFSFFPRTVNHALGATPHEIWIWGSYEDPFAGTKSRGHWRWNARNGIYCEVIPSGGVSGAITNVTSTSFDVDGALNLNDTSEVSNLSSYNCIFFAQNGTYVKCGNMSSSVTLGWKPRAVFWNETGDPDTTYNWIRERDVLGDNSSDNSTVSSFSGITNARTDDKIIPSATGFTTTGITTGGAYIAVK